MKVIHVKANDRVVEPTRHGSHIMKSVCVRGGQIANLTQVAEATLPLGKAEVEMHRHPTMWECYLVLEGKAVYSVGDERVEVEPGDFLAIPPDTLHNQEVTEGPHRIFYFGVATDMAQ
ncbi:MAG: cupin domain-containing protein [Candidatus Brennerbacteria bacterium]